MLCERLEPDLHAYVEGWLTGRRAEHVEAHLKECALCQQKVADWQAITSSLRTLPTLPAPAQQPALRSSTTTPSYEAWAVALLTLIILLPTAWWLSRVPIQQVPEQVVRWTPPPIATQLTEQTLQSAYSLWNQVQQEVLR